jgi:hypothetical protein
VKDLASLLATNTYWMASSRQLNLPSLLGLATYTYWFLKIALWKTAARQLYLPRFRLAAT